jgi:hypothetical protein
LGSTQEQNPRAGATAKAYSGIILILLVVYCLQVATPLRLHPDTVVLLSMAESAAQGGGLLYHRQPTVFPPGYPALVALLVKLNLARVWLIIGMNVGFLMAGLLAVRSILYPKFINERSFASGICIFSLLSFVPIKYSAIPLTDPPFFGVAMCCLALMESAAARLTLHKALAGTILVIVAICTRWIGIALIPALLWMVLLRPEVRRYFARSVRTIAAAALFAALLSCSRVACLHHIYAAARFPRCSCRAHDRWLGIGYSRLSPKGTGRDHDQPAFYGFIACDATRGSVCRSGCCRIGVRGSDFAPPAVRAGRCVFRQLCLGDPGVAVLRSEILAARAAALHRICGSSAASTSPTPVLQSDTQSIRRRVCDAGDSRAWFQHVDQLVAFRFRRCLSGLSLGVLRGGILQRIRFDASGSRCITTSARV